jgi:LuxR family transcriptional regulator, maltose regulon positive regulatory protein
MPDDLVPAIDCLACRAGRGPLEDDRPANPGVDMNVGLTDQRFLLPFLPPRHLSRRLLLDRLDEGGRAALTVLSAGAGAGKTVLLSEWARQQDRPVAWLALTSSDNNPGRFWRLFLEAGGATGQVYPPSAWTPGGTVELLDSVFGRSAEPAERTVIVLDDAHLLTDPEILDGLDRIVQRWSHCVRLMVAARSDPMLPLHRYRLADQVLELRAADLAMTSAEVKELLSEHGVRLPDAAIRTLTARTEGWPAGLRLAAMRMEGAERPTDFIASLAMDEGSIGEYLTQEVLAALPQRVQSLLIRTSFLDDVTGPLASAVTGIDDCDSLLTDLARTNSFVIPVNPARTTFRYHALFREMLRQLARGQPSAVQQAQYARAAAWYRQQGDLPHALEWSLRAGDSTSARSVLAHGGLAEAFVGHQELAGAGLPDLARDSPPDGASPAELAEFAVTQRAILAIVTDSAAAEGMTAMPPHGPSPLDRDPELTVTELLADVMLGQKIAAFGTVDAAARRLLDDDGLRASVDAVPGLRSSILLAQAKARLSIGEVADVDPLLHQALVAVPPDGLPVVHLEALSLVAFVSISRRPRYADDAIDGAEALLTRHPTLSRPVILDLAIARRAHLGADLPAMAAAMRRVHAAGPVYADTGQAAAVAYIQATLHAVLGDLGQAQVLLRDNPAVNRTAVGLFGVIRDRELAEIETALGRPRSALQILQRHRGSAEALIAEVAAARAHLALGELNPAAARLRAVMTTPSPFVDRALLVEAELCLAEIAHRRNDEGRTVELVDRALQIAAGEIVLPFVQATPALRPVVARHRTLTARWPGPGPAIGAPDLPRPRRDSLSDTLTHREQAVLRLMTTSMSTAEIADELCLSVNTIKTHLAAIYRKLSVGRRRAAVLRARQLELL